jgi:hypothetical protein
MISNGGSMKFGGRCESVHLQIGQNNLKSHTFTIDMGGCDILLSSKCLCTLDTILMYFKELTKKFKLECQQYTFQGIRTTSPEIINSHRMEKLLKKGHSDIISKLNGIQTIQTPYVHLDLQTILSKHHTIFSIPHGLSPSYGLHDNSIPIVPGNIPPNVLLYRHTFS